MLKRQRKIVSVAVILSLAVAMGAGLVGKPVEAANGYGISNPVTDSNGVTTWDKVKFGSYYQTAEFQPEPIKWRVLSVKGDDAFLLADENLDCKPYNSSNERNVTWEMCSLRKWLNEDFYNEAFSSSEQEAIQKTVVVNKDNPKYGTPGGKNTTDRIFLLSEEEVKNAEYGFESSIVEYSDTRESKNTDYANCNHAYSSGEGKGGWWLRSPEKAADTIDFVSEVYSDGFVGSSDVKDEEAVRPALHLNLSSFVYTDAGEVDSEGNVTNKHDGIHNPTIDRDRKGVTTWDCVYLGNYKQSAAWEKEPIEWRVLSVAGDDAFLLADKNLDCKPYHFRGDYVTWETCSLREWLNNDFYNEAFSSSERAAIRETVVVNEDNPKYETEGGNDTTDRIYLLSLNEAKNTEYGFISDYEKNTKTRESKNTDYANCNYANSSEEGKGTWWIRLPGSSNVTASSVNYSGDVNWLGQGVYVCGKAIRPVLHLNLPSSSWSKSGQVTSDGIEVPMPSKSPSESESPKPSGTPQETATTTPQETTPSSTVTPSPSVNPPQTTNEPEVTVSPVPTSPGESPSASESPKPGGTPDQTATTPPLSTNAPQMTNEPEVTASPVPTGNSADTGKLGKVSIKSAKNNKKSKAVLKWKKVNGVSGYQIQYALDKKFAKGRKTKTTAGTRYILKKLKKRKTYYVRIRAFQKTGSKKVYGAWSKVKKVKIKK